MFRQERIARRQLTHSRALIGEEPPKTEEQELSEIKKKRQRMIEEREDSTRYFYNNDSLLTIQSISLKHQNALINMELAKLQKELEGTRSADEARQKEELERKLERQKIREERLSNTNV